MIAHLENVPYSYRKIIIWKNCFNFTWRFAILFILLLKSLIIESVLAGVSYLCMSKQKCNLKQTADTEKKNTEEQEQEWYDLQAFYYHTVNIVLIMKQPNTFKCIVLNIMLPSFNQDKNIHIKLY